MCDLTFQAGVDLNGMSERSKLIPCKKNIEKKNIIIACSHVAALVYILADHMTRSIISAIASQDTITSLCIAPMDNIDTRIPLVVILFNLILPHHSCDADNEDFFARVNGISRAK